MHSSKINRTTKVFFFLIFVVSDFRLSWGQFKKENGSFLFVLFGLLFVEWKRKLGVKMAVFSEYIVKFLSPKIFGKIKDVIFCLLKNTHFLMVFVLSREMVLLGGRYIIES